MTEARKKQLWLGAIFGLAILLGLYLGWTFHRGYWTSLRGWNRAIINLLALSPKCVGNLPGFQVVCVFEALLVSWTGVCALGIVASFVLPSAQWRAKIAALASPLCLPVIFLLTGLFLRLGVEGGWLGGVKVTNLLDSRPVPRIINDCASNVWRNRTLLVGVSIAALIFGLGRIGQILVIRAPSSGKH